VRTFLLVLQHSASLGVDADLLRNLSAFDVEGISEPAASSFFLQFLVGNLTWISFEGYRSRLFDADPVTWSNLAF